MTAEYKHGSVADVWNEEDVVVGARRPTTGCIEGHMVGQEIVEWGQSENETISSNIVAGTKYEMSFLHL